MSRTTDYWHHSQKGGSWRIGRYVLLFLAADLLVGLIITALIAAGVLTRFGPFSAATPNPTCYQHISVIIDQSDPLPADRIIDHLAVGVDPHTCLATKYTVAALTPNAEAPLRVILHDLPDPGGAADHWRLFLNPRTAERQREELFFKPLKEALKQAFAAPEHQKQSPLIEGLASYANLARGNVGSRRDLTVVVSDLRQHSTCSFIAKAKKRKATPAELCAAVIANHPTTTLSGDVLLLVVRRPPDGGLPQDDSFKRFWIDWLTAAGANSIEWREVS